MQPRAEPSPLTPALSLLASRPPSFIVKIHFNQTSDPVSQTLQSGHTSKQPSPNPVPVSKHISPFIPNLSSGVHLASRPPSIMPGVPSKQVPNQFSPPPLKTALTAHPSSALSSKCVPKQELQCLKPATAPASLSLPKLPGKTCPVS